MSILSMGSRPGRGKYSRRAPVAALPAPDGRLTLTSGVSVTTADVTGATSIYYTPAVGSQIPIYNGSAFATASFSELTLALDSASGHAGYQQSGKNFDLFVFNNGGVPALGTGPAWTSDTARGTGAGTTEIELKNGLWANKNSIVLRFGASAGNTVTVPADQATYVGSFRATADGQATDTLRQRLLFNAYNQSPRPMRRIETTASWTYSTAAWRQANGSATNQFELLAGLSGVFVSAYTKQYLSTSTGTPRLIGGAIGLDSTAAVAADSINGLAWPTTTVPAQVRGDYEGYPGLGFHYLAWLEFGGGADTQTWFGNTIYGMLGRVAM